MKSFLTSPDIYLSILEDKEAQFRTLEDRAEKTTTAISGMPSGGGQDRNAVLASLADAKAEYYRWYNRWRDHRSLVRNFIGDVVISDTRKVILKLRYVDKMVWAEVLVSLNNWLKENSKEPISERQMFYEHLKALEDSADWINLTGKYLFIGRTNYDTQ